MLQWYEGRSPDCLFKNYTLKNIYKHKNCGSYT